MVTFVYPGDLIMDYCATIEEFLTSIDPSGSLLKYANDFRRMDIHNTTAVKYLRGRDLDNFSVHVSTIHRRMILNAVAKIQTPNSKLGLQFTPSPAAVHGLVDGSLKTDTPIDIPTTSMEPKRLFSNTSAATRIPEPRLGSLDSFEDYTYSSPVDR